MMKYTTLSMLMVLAAVIAVGYSSVSDPSPNQPDLTSLDLGYASEDLPESSYALDVSEGVESSEGEADALNGSSPAVSAGNRLLFRGQYIRDAIWNTVRIHNQTWRGSTAITWVRTWQVGADQGATAWVTDGGIGSTYVTVQLRSAVGRGFNIIIEVYGWQTGLNVSTM